MAVMPMKACIECGRLMRSSRCARAQPRPLPDRELAEGGARRHDRCWAMRTLRAALTGLLPTIEGLSLCPSAVAHAL